MKLSRDSSRPSARRPTAAPPPTTHARSTHRPPLATLPLQCSTTIARCRHLLIGPVRAPSTSACAVSRPAPKPTQTALPLQHPSSIPPASEPSPAVRPPRLDAKRPNALQATTAPWRFKHPTPATAGPPGPCPSCSAVCSLQLLQVMDVQAIHVRALYTSDPCQGTVHKPCCGNERNNTSLRDW